MKLDHYEILGVPSWANQKDIKRAFRKLVKDLHPDRLPNGPAKDESERKLKQIIESYSILSKRQPERIPSRQRRKNKTATNPLLKNKYVAGLTSYLKNQLRLAQVSLFHNKHLVAIFSYLKNTYQSALVLLFKHKYLRIIIAEFKYILRSRRIHKLWKRVGAPAIILGALLTYGILGFSLLSCYWSCFPNW